MYKNIFKGIICSLFLTTIACTDLDVTIESQLTPNVYPKDEKDFTYISGPAYSTFLKALGRDYWMLQSWSADQSTLVALSSGWYDGGRYEQLFKHTWTVDHIYVTGAYQNIFNSVSVCNNILDLLEAAPDGEAKTLNIAQVRCMRAVYFYMLMDGWGGVPIVKKFGEAVENRNTREEVAKFVESELLAILDQLPKNVDNSTYGKPTCYLGYAMLAKLYQNWQEYTGQTPDQNKVISYCDKIIESGNYDLSDEWSKIFNYDNGPQIKDFVYAFPMFRTYKDPSWYYCRWFLHGYHRYIMGTDIGWTPSSAGRILPSFYHLFENNDLRKKCFIVGKQYKYDGSPYMVATTYSQLDQIKWPSSHPEAKKDTNWWFTIDPDTLYFRSSAQELAFNVGNSEIERAMGARCVKFGYDKLNTSGRDQDNDIPYIRYTDILLMKAEAILRGGAATRGENALGLVNQVRKRVNATAYTSIDLEELYKERKREFFHELWMRPDMIRFGHFEDPYWCKTNNEKYRRLYPIPFAEMQLHPGWKNNPGYE